MLDEDSPPTARPVISDSLVMVQPLILRGRAFLAEDIELIVQCVHQNYEKGRTHISRVVCEELDWKQPNGWYKDRACRDVLRKMEERGYLTLPPPLSSAKAKLDDRRVTGKRCVSTTELLTKYDLITPITEFPSKIDLEFAKGNQSEAVWNALVDQYHYKGYSVTPGRAIKYLIRGDGRILGAIGFSSPAWRLESRDKLLNLLGLDRATLHEVVINNSRFLILPHVSVKNLASHLLSRATKRIFDDWQEYYSLTPLVVETFIQPSLYSGTCYAAANWIEIGVTKGYSKRGSSHRNSQEPKKIYLYGLTKAMRQAIQALVRDCVADT